MQLAPALHRIGDDFINCYLVEEAGEVTVVDAGVPGLYGDLVRELAAMGRTIDDVRALVAHARPLRPHRLRRAGAR